MFGLVLSPPVPLPKAINVRLPEIPDEEYQKLASKLGINTVHPQSDTLKFEAFLADLGVRIYDKEKVKAYLNAQYGSKTPWGWRRVSNNTDIKDGVYVVGFSASKHLRLDTVHTIREHVWKPKHNSFVIGGRDLALYSKPIPYPVLVTMDKIATKYPAYRGIGAHFYVSDEAVVLPQPPLDPFLMVVYNDKSYIIERWDEPKFRD